MIDPDVMNYYSKQTLISFPINSKQIKQKLALFKEILFSSRQPGYIGVNFNFVLVIPSGLGDMLVEAMFTTQKLILVTSP